jgi:hypothetical protein
MDLVEESTTGSGMLIKAAAIFIFGVIFLSGAVGAIQNSDPKTVTLTLTEIPSPGDTITLGAHVFEFVDSGAVQADHIPVQIGSTLIDTKANFEAAVTANSDFSVE